MAAGVERDKTRIERTLEIYFQMRAIAGLPSADGMFADRLLCRNLAIVDTIVRRWERTQAASDAG